MSSRRHDLNNQQELPSYDPSLSDPVSYQLDAGKNWSFHDLTIDELSSPAGAKFLLYQYNIKIRELKALQEKYDKLSDENTKLLVENSTSSERAKLFVLEILGGGLIGYATSLLVPPNATNPYLFSGVVWLIIGLFITLIIRQSDLSALWKQFRKRNNHD